MKRYSTRESIRELLSGLPGDWSYDESEQGISVGIPFREYMSDEFHLILSLMDAGNRLQGVRMSSYTREDRVFEYPF